MEWERDYPFDTIPRGKSDARGNDTDIRDERKTPSDKDILDVEDCVETIKLLEPFLLPSGS